VAGGDLAPGDLVFINVYRHDDLSTTTQIDGNGNVTLPIVGNVTIGGMTQEDASARIARALEAIVKQPRVTVSRSGATPMRGGERTAEMRTELVQLHNSDATAMYDALAGMLSAGGNMGFDADTNSLIITDTPSTLQNVLAVIAQLDQLRTQITQVHIATKIAEVETEALKELGVKWFVKDDQASGGYFPNSRQSTQVNSVRTPTDALFNERLDTGDFRNSGGTNREFVDEPDWDRRLQVPLNVAGPGQMFFGYLDGGFDLGLLVDALASENEAELLASPYIRTVNHKTAVIEMTEKFPFQEVANIGLSTTANVEFLDIGITLEVTPHVRRDPSGGTYIQLELEPEVSFVSGMANGVPIRNVRRTSSVANVRDGQTLAIGGIMRTDMRDVSQKVPVLGDVPVLGNLFKHQESVKSNRELMIFVTPEVFENPEDITVDQMIDLDPEVHGANRIPPGAMPAEMRRE
jgi:type II secretory pathway component GspD/PulD (secretin)